MMTVSKLIKTIGNILLKNVGMKQEAMLEKYGKMKYNFDFSCFVLIIKYLFFFVCFFCFAQNELRPAPASAAGGCAR